MQTLSDGTPITIRPFRNRDIELTRQWWNARGLQGPSVDMIPTDGAFVLEIDGVAAVSLCVYITAAEGFCLLENLIGNPEMKGPRRKEATRILVEHCERYARSYGHTRVFCFTESPALEGRYKELGYRTTKSGFISMTRQIQGGS